MPEYTKRAFVFGSNLAGRHGKGAAFIAMLKWGAKYGIGDGPTGNAYGIPTKDHKLKVLPLRDIKKSVDLFIKYAEKHPETEFLVTAIGTGLAGYSKDEIAPLFHFAPLNCRLPLSWKSILPEVKGRKFWLS